MAFDQVEYEERGGWRTALSEDLYQRLGLDPDAHVDAAAVQNAYQVRYQWWQHKDRMQRSGSQPPLVKEVGPHIADALKKLADARQELADSAGRQKYEQKRAAAQVGEWRRQLGDLLDVVLVDGRLSPKERQGILDKAKEWGIPRARAEEIIAAVLHARGATLGEDTAASDAGAPPVSETHYQTLGLSETATAKEVEEAYRREHQRYINDRDKARANARFYVVSQAYETLRDPEARRRYDATVRSKRDASGGPLVTEGNPSLDLLRAEGGAAPGPFTFRLRLAGRATSPVLVARNGGGGALEAAVKATVPWLEVIDAGSGARIDRIHQARLPQRFCLRVAPHRDSSLRLSDKRTGQVEMTYKSGGRTVSKAISVSLQIETQEERVRTVTGWALGVGSAALLPYGVALLGQAGRAALSLQDRALMTALVLPVTMCLAAALSGRRPRVIGWGVSLGALGLLMYLVAPAYSLLWLLVPVVLPLPVSLGVVRRLIARGPTRPAYQPILACALAFGLCWSGSLGASWLGLAAGPALSRPAAASITRTEVPGSENVVFAVADTSALSVQVDYVGEVWLEVKNNGRVVFSGSRRPGDSPLVISGAREVRVRAGRPANLRLVVNGQALTDLPHEGPKNLIITAGG